LVTETFWGTKKEGWKGGEEAAKGPDFAERDGVRGNSGNEGEEGDSTFSEASETRARYCGWCSDATRAKDVEIEGGVCLEEPVKTLLPTRCPLGGGGESASRGRKRGGLAVMMMMMMMMF
jgi:hypothetical protein